PSTVRVQARPDAGLEASGTDAQRAHVAAIFESQAGPAIDIEWVGPDTLLLGTHFFRRMLRLVDELQPSRTRVRHAFVTGGAGIDDEWASVFAEHRVVARIGLDGPRRLHDADRVPREGWSSFDDAVAAVELLRRRDVDVDLRCSVRPANVGSPLTVYRFLCSRCDSPSIEFVPLVVGDGIVAGPGSVDPHRWGAFLIAVFDTWVTHDVAEVVVSNFDDALEAFMEGGVERGAGALSAGDRAFHAHIEQPMRTMVRLCAEGRFPEEIMTLHEH
ncbi:MAG: hypothetical protein RJA49_1175, partial [Actinomycetota bacterium]